MSPSGGGRGRLVLLGGAALVLVLGLLVLVGRPGEDRWLDPRSHTERGVGAAMDILRSAGGDVDLEVSPAELLEPSGGGDYDVALLLRDQSDDASRRSEVLEWVREGGVLVVADPLSALAPSPVPGSEPSLFDLAESPSEHPDLHDDSAEVVPAELACTIDVLAGLEVTSLQVAGHPYYFPEGGQDEACFGEGRDAFITANTRGRGVVVALGSAGLLSNEALASQHQEHGELDNALVVTALMAPEPGTRLAVLDPRSLGVEDVDLIGLVPTWVKRVGVQLLVVVGLFVVWRARRLGRPVEEPQPVDVASSDLVAAVGGLLQRIGSPQHAAELLRADLRQDLTARLGLAAELSPNQFHEAITVRTSLDGERLRLALGPGPVTNDDELLAVAYAIDTVRKEVLDSVGFGS